MTQGSPLIVFDLDGTLVDTAPDLITSLNYVLKREGLSPIPLASARNMIGAGVRKLIERGLEAEDRVMSEPDLVRVTDDFIAFYAEHIADESRPFEGTIEALDELEASGFKFAVCTNKIEWLSKRLIEKLGLTSRFAAICGGDTFGVSKPDPIILRQTIARAGADAKNAIMVGDSGADIGVARRAGVPVIGVTFGYTDTPIAELAPDAIITSMRELAGAISKIRAGRT